MRELSMVGADSAAAVISFYSLHHLDLEGVSVALRGSTSSPLREWRWTPFSCKVLRRRFQH
ncbi:MAG: hypothetical protein ACI8P2_005081, partial [Candidatus Latescibacterota bacterium]